MFGIGQGVDGEQGEKHLFIFNVGFFWFFFFSFPADNESFGGLGEADVIRLNVL